MALRAGHTAFLLAEGRTPPYYSAGLIDRAVGGPRSPATLGLTQPPERYVLRQTSVLVLGLTAVSLAATAAPLQGQARVASPDGRNQVTIEVRDGRLNYSLTRDGRALILPSLLGFEFRGAPPLPGGRRMPPCR